MARKLRIEFEGAIYHVLNRGNYRRDLFLSSGEAKAFVLALEGGDPTGSGRFLLVDAPVRSHQPPFHGKEAPDRGKN